MPSETLLDDHKASVSLPNFFDHPTNEVRAAQKLFKEEASLMFLLYLDTGNQVQRLF